MRGDGPGSHVHAHRVDQLLELLQSVRLSLPLSVSVCICQQASIRASFQKELASGQTKPYEAEGRGEEQWPGRRETTPTTLLLAPDPQDGTGASCPCTQGSSLPRSCSREEGGPGQGGSARDRTALAREGLPPWPVPQLTQKTTTNDQDR